MDPVACRDFVTTVRAGSITAAAQALGLARPTLSRRLAALEAELGVALLHRSTRAVRPTPAGAWLFDRVAPALDAVDAAGAALRHQASAVAGRLRVTAPPLLAGPITRILTALMRAHPALEARLHTGIAPVDLRQDQVEVAVRAGRLDDPELVQRRLFTEAVGAVAAPAYLSAHGEPQTPADLAQHALLRGIQGDGQPRQRWPLRPRGSLAVGGRFVANDQHALLAAALDGAGIALLSARNARAGLADGRLVPVLPAAVGTALDLHVVTARRSLQPARVRAFVAAVVAWAETERAQAGAVGGAPR